MQLCTCISLSGLHGNNCGGMEYGPVGMGMRLSMNQISIPFQEREVGKLLYQGLLHVSEPKFGLKAGKERQVFLFATALVFARKVDLTQAKFKYEYKFKLPVSLRVNNS